MEMGKTGLKGGMVWWLFRVGFERMINVFSGARMNPTGRGMAIRQGERSKGHFIVY